MRAVELKFFRIVNGSKVRVLSFVDIVFVGHQTKERAVLVEGFPNGLCREDEVTCA